MLSLFMSCSLCSGLSRPSNQEVTMKVIIVILSFAAVAFAQLDVLVKHEVNVIVGANPGISVDQCSDICDGLFDLIDVVDEQVSDTMCRTTCDCEINQNCAASMTTQATPQDTTQDMTGTDMTMAPNGTDSAPADSNPTMNPATTANPHTHPPHTTHPHTKHPHTHHPHPSHPTHPPHHG